MENLYYTNSHPYYYKGMFGKDTVPPTDRNWECALETYDAVLLEIQQSKGIPVIHCNEGQNLYHQLHGLDFNHGHYQNCSQLYTRPF